MTSNETLSPVIAEFNGVSFRYKGNADVLKDIHFSLAPGSFHFMTGESGAGKTSLLGLLYLDHLPTKGRVRLFGQTVDSLSRSAKAMIRRQIGVVFQDYRLLDHLTAFDNVALPLRLIGEKEAEIRRHVSELLTWVGLEKQMRSYPQELSGGEQQRIAIARAVIHKPALLLADEPTGNVDDAMAKRLLHLFLELNKLGTTVVVATHNMELVKTFKFPQLHLTHGKLDLIPPYSSYTEMASKLLNKGSKNA
ncbi:MAG: cell division ATP-binding protein FtsE [Alphaproteobacteria bacterium]|nr:cell division ATP-binding protein FtsE [Alphaproteobacteria bacterium]